jgi:hypothetical protein
MLRRVSRDNGSPMGEPSIQANEVSYPRARARQQCGAGHRVVTARRVVNDIAASAARGATLESDELDNQALVARQYDAAAVQQRQQFAKFAPERSRTRRDQQVATTIAPAVGSKLGPHSGRQDDIIE